MSSQYQQSSFKQLLAFVLRQSSLTGCRPSVVKEGQISWRDVWNEVFPSERAKLLAIQVVAGALIYIAGIHILTQWVNMSIAYGILHAALPASTGYQVGIVPVMRVGAVGGALLYATGLVVLAPLSVLIQLTYIRSITRPMSKAVLALSWAIVFSLEVAYAAAAGALGATVLQKSQRSPLDALHAAAMGAVGSAITATFILFLRSRTKKV